MTDLHSREIFNVPSVCNNEHVTQTKTKQTVNVNMNRLINYRGLVWKNQ